MLMWHGHTTLMDILKTNLNLYFLEKIIKKIFDSKLPLKIMLRLRV